MLSDIDVYVENLRQANQTLALEVRQKLDADRSVMSTETAQFRKEVRSDRAAMADALRTNLDEAQAALFAARAAMSEQIAEFRANVRTANTVAAQALHARLDADRAALATSTDEMMADIDSFLAEIRSDAAGAAEAWLLVKQMLAAEEAPAATAVEVKAVEAAAPSASMSEAMPAPEASMPPTPSEPQAGAQGNNPLIEINGIGPSTQERLYEAGIKTFADLAAADPDTLRSIAGSAVTRRYDVEDWIEEARQRRSE
jgi:predicted flap endonuclease-1-like 5' DNA nuclease